MRPFPKSDQGGSDAAFFFALTCQIKRATLFMGRAHCIFCRSWWRHRFRSSGREGATPGQQRGGGLPKVFMEIIKLLWWSRCHSLLLLLFLRFSAQDSPAAPAGTVSLFDEVIHMDAHRFQFIGLCSGKVVRFGDVGGEVVDFHLSSLDILAFGPFGVFCRKPFPGSKNALRGDLAPLGTHPVLLRILW